MRLTAEDTNGPDPAESPLLEIAVSDGEILADLLYPQVPVGVDPQAPVSAGDRA